MSSEVPGIGTYPNMVVGNAVYRVVEAVTTEAFFSCVRRPSRV